MNVKLVVPGLILLSTGVGIALFPHHVRNFVSPREWEENPDRARQKQEFRAKLLGFIAGGVLGLPLLVAGLL